VKVEWDPDKAAANEVKHGVDFADAVSVLEDQLALTIVHHEHGEERFVTIGVDAFGRTLVVVYTELDEGFRLISARRATRRERKQYEG
jgi:uncharacterized DUF497 family protein